MAFDDYFDKRSKRFSSFYKSRPLSRALGRGALFDRADVAVELVLKFDAKRVLDVGCGSGPLFAPLVARGVSVTGIDPAPAMVALAEAEAATLPPGKVEVRRQSWEDLAETDAYDAAVALGVFDYVARPIDLLNKMAAAAPIVIGSFPARGARVALRKLRYGVRGVGVYGYQREQLTRLAEEAGLSEAEVRPLGRVGWVGCFARRDPGS